MQLYIKQFMFSYGMIPITKHKLCYHKKNIRYFGERMIDDTEHHWQNSVISSQGRNHLKLLILVTSYVQDHCQALFLK